MEKEPVLAGFADVLAAAAGDAPALLPAALLLSSLARHWPAVCATRCAAEAGDSDVPAPDARSGRAAGAAGGVTGHWNKGGPPWRRPTCGST